MPDGSVTPNRRAGRSPLCACGAVACRICKGRQAEPCACGCGELVPTAQYPSRQKRFFHNHHARLQSQDLSRYTVEDRGYDTPCWIWQGFIDDRGYGQAGRNTGAHRALYEEHVGPIPDGLEIDHLCRVTACVNPGHLEPVTRQENMRRTRRRFLDGECAKGHSLADAWVDPKKDSPRCRICHRDAQRRYVARKAAATDFEVPTCLCGHKRGDHHSSGAGWPHPPRFGYCYVTGCDCRVFEDASPDRSAA